MNDLETKLRALTFREPPPGWRGSMVTAATAEVSWQKWFAPHPAAWAALAAVWIVLTLISQTFEKASGTRSNMAATRIIDPMAKPSLLAFQLRAASVLEPPL